MATTKIWPVYDSLRRVLDYANNPEKTEYSSLRDVIHYAENGEKTMLTGDGNCISHHRRELRFLG